MKEATANIYALFTPIRPSIFHQFLMSYYVEYEAEKN